MRDTGGQRFMTATIRLHMGDAKGAQVDFDFACALQPSQREMYSREFSLILETRNAEVGGQEAPVAEMQAVGIGGG